MKNKKHRIKKFVKGMSIKRWGTVTVNFETDSIGISLFHFVGSDLDLLFQSNKKSSLYSVIIKKAISRLERELRRIK